MPDQDSSNQPPEAAEPDDTAAPPPDETPLPPKPPRKRALRRLADTLAWRVHWLLPNHLPWSREDRADRLAHDKKINDASRIEDGEELRAPAVWGVELFGPNESERLYEALKRLGWRSAFDRANEGALTWARQQRAYGHGGIYNIGYVGRRNAAAHVLSRHNYASLPEDVDHLMVRVHQIVPALTCVVVCFVLKEDAARRYARELNQERASYSQRNAGWTLSYHDPSHIKQAAVDEVRARLRDTIHGWFASNLPGYFAGSFVSRRLPMAELFTTKGDDVFGGEQMDYHFDWRRIICNGHPHNVWTSSATPGLRFADREESWPHEPENALTVSMSLAQIPQDRLRSHRKGDLAIVLLGNQTMDGVLTYFAAKAFLVEVARDLKATREELDLSRNNRKTMRTINCIQRFFDRNAGVPAVVRELAQETALRKLVERYCGTFTAPAFIPGEPARQLGQELQYGLNYRATALLEDEASTREHFDQLCAILSVRESIRTQFRMEILTIAALLVAAASLLVAMPDSWTVKAQALIGAIRK